MGGLENVERRLDLEWYMKPLKPRQRDAIARRFGLAGDGGAQLKEIAEEFGVSAGRVRQIVERSIRVMQQRAGQP